MDIVRIVHTIRTISKLRLVSENSYIYSSILQKFDTVYMAVLVDTVWTTMDNGSTLMYTLSELHLDVMDVYGQVRTWFGQHLICVMDVYG